MDIINDFKKISEYAKELLDTEDTDRSKVFYEVVQNEINKIDKKYADPSVIKYFQTTTRKLKWICLEYLSEDEIIEMAEKHFADTFSINENYNIWEHFKIKLLTELNLDKRDNFKLRLRNALKNNEEILTKSGETKTITGLIKIYSSGLGENIISELDQQKFFQTNQQLQKLNDNDKMKAIKLINFYERLKISSKSINGIEEGILLPEQEFPFGSVRNGELISPAKKDKLKIIEKILSENEKITNDEGGNNIEQLKKLAGQYPAGSLERKAIEEEIGKLEKVKS